MGSDLIKNPIPSQNLSPLLSLVMPVFNEEDVVSEVITEWTNTLDAMSIDYEFRVYNDGSGDGTAEILDTLALQSNRLIVTHKTNSGHGPTILQGYRESLGEWVLQTDSDRELSAEEFVHFWAQREKYDYIQGYRIHRVAPLHRRFFMKVALCTVELLFGKGLQDSNCPYRLMRGNWIRRKMAEIPQHTLTPNLLLSGFALRDKLRITEVPVEHRHRRTGVVSIRRWKMVIFASKSFIQVLIIRFMPRLKR